MPTLDWIGKKAVVNHHREVPFRLLQCDPKLSVGDPDAGNLLVQGDNLEALKALLPHYAGKVKCIYIDPPYNTGIEGWVYNDKVNSPEIRQWLKQVVGKEGEDLSRHDKWLCMMCPRLTLLRDFLQDNGLLFISIDDNELHHLRALLSEVTGLYFVGMITWERKRKGSHLSRKLTKKTEYILVYSRSRNEVELPGERVGEDEDFPLIKRTNSLKKLIVHSESLGETKLKDGVYKPGTYGKGNTAVRLTHSVTVSGGRFLTDVHLEGRFIWTQSNLDQEMAAGGKCFLRTKNFSLRALKAQANQGYKGLSSLLTKDFGTNEDASAELAEIFGTEVNETFQYSKPSSLIRTLLRAATLDSPNAIILDSFAGSATTGQAVLQLNKELGGNRKFVCVEIDSHICENISAHRLHKVIAGYGSTKGIPAGFSYCKLANPLFDEFGNITDAVTYADLARHVYFTETGVPIPKQPRKNNPLLGVHDGTAVYLLYNGILGDKRPHGGNVLTGKVFNDLPEHDGPKVVYGEACRIGADRLRAMGVVFRQVPYEIKVD